MSKGFIIVAIFFFVILVSVALIYFFYEKPAQEQQIINSHVNFRFIDSQTNEQVSTNYVISILPINSIYKEGVSNLDSYTREDVSINTSFRVVNKELNNLYYTNFLERYDNIGSAKDYRLDIPLTKTGKLSASSSNIFFSDTLYNLTISSSGSIKNLGICLLWSKNFISVKINSTEFAEEFLVTRYKNKVDRCYNLKQDLSDNSTLITLSYKIFGSIDNSDFIKVFILDGDNSYIDTSKIVREDINYNDIGARDLEYVIK